MSMKYILGVLALIMLLLPGCSENPLSGRVKELERRVDTLETSVEDVEEQRQELLQRLDSMEVTPQNAEEIADIREILQKPQMTATDIAQLEARIAELERASVDWSAVNPALTYSVYAVFWGLPLPNGEYKVGFLGTAFAVDDTRLLTNAHVVDRLVELDEELEAFNEKFGTNLYSNWLVVRNKTTRLYCNYNYYFIGWYRTHSAWDPDNLESPDVAYLKISKGRIYYKAALASNSDVYRLREGQRIATMGFPGEIQNGGWDGISPVSNRDEIPPLIATFKDGTISALRPPSPLATVSTRSTYIVQYNFDVTGGTSGSPVYDTSGKVIAVNNCKYPYTDLDFGIRVDKANELLSGVAKQVPQPCGEKQDVIEMLQGRDIRTLKWCEPSEVLENLD
ncbi:MAG: hypothetical protein DRQ02_11150 [Candidatus Latescibacterota bacterium]|nr:MAG: hypothetical protein DRQ02_11150 [Candidatus Latescibacterota bacterium]